MLGKEVGHEVGQQTGARVLPDPQRGTIMEISSRSEGTLLGVHYEDVSTYESWLEPDGSLRGSGRGMTMGDDGERGTWEGNGVGVLAPDGSAKYRGAIFYRSDTPRLSELNGKCCIFEYDVDPGGKSEGKFFLWE
jgi:hypothetical protein